MAELAYLTADVFTDRPFGGNPLAVFPDAGGISAATMQRLAAELALSETVFVLPAEQPAHTCRLRIFTPATELPFAGHPTVGTALVLAETGRLGPMGERQAIIFEEAAGAVPVTIDRTQAGLLRATLTSPRVPAEVPGSLDAGLLARVAGLAPDAVEAGVAPGIYSAGVPFAMLPVRPEFLSDAAVDLALWRAHLAGTAAPHLYLVALDDWATGRNVRVRMFAPAMGIVEDPATGAAAAALAGFLFDRQRPGDGRTRWSVFQGDEIGRPSRIELTAEVVAGRLAAAQVGGTAILMSRGSFTLPA